MVCVALPSHSRETFLYARLRTLEWDLWPLNVITNTVTLFSVGQIFNLTTYDTHSVKVAKCHLTVLAKWLPDYSLNAGHVWWKKHKTLGLPTNHVKFPFSLSCLITKCSKNSAAKCYHKTEYPFHCFGCLIYTKCLIWFKNIQQSKSTIVKTFSITCSLPYIHLHLEIHLSNIACINPTLIHSLPPPTHPPCPNGV